MPHVSDAPRTPLLRLIPGFRVVPMFRSCVVSSYPSPLHRQRSRIQCLWRCMVTLALLGGLAGSVPLRAQTLFTWPSRIPDGAHLTTIDDCLASVRRLIDSTQSRSSVWRDTLSYIPAEALEKFPPRVIETAARCSAQFDLTTVPPTEFVSMLRLLLYADRDADANTLVQQRLAAIPAAGDPTATPPLTADSIRIAILDTVLTLLNGSQPARLHMAIPYVEQLLAIPTARVNIRVSHAFNIATMAQSHGDSALSRQWVERGIALIATATEEDKQQISDEFGKHAIFTMLFFLNVSEFADSLRVGTDTYLRHIERLWATIEKDENAKFQLPIGVQAPPLQAEYWFDHTGSTKHRISSTESVVRPVPGRVNLVVFFDPWWRRPGEGWAQLYVLKRFKQRFPTLEITLMSQTQGYVGPVEPSSPEQEADMYRQRFLEFFQLPVTVGITKTPWWRLEDPDRRRINQDVVNAQEYGFGFMKATSSSLYLVDPEGRLVAFAWLSRGDLEKFIEKLIEAVMQQTSK
jgi:hypothetical protein